jgi:hypothetical protein
MVEDNSASSSWRLFSLKDERTGTREKPFTGFDPLADRIGEADSHRLGVLESAGVVAPGDGSDFNPTLLIVSTV